MSDNEITYRSYHAEIAAIAQDCLRQQYEDDREVSEVAHENVDGHQWIIYNRFHAQIMAFTMNEDAYFDTYGKLEADNYSDTMQQLAFAAMLADVESAIQGEEERMVRTYTVVLSELEWNEDSSDAKVTQEVLTVVDPDGELTSEDDAIAAAVDITEEQRGKKIASYQGDATLKITFTQD